MRDVNEIVKAKNVNLAEFPKLQEWRMFITRIYQKMLVHNKDLSKNVPISRNLVCPVFLIWDGFYEK